MIGELTGRVRAISGVFVASLLDQLTTALVYNQGIETNYLVSQLAELSMLYIFLFPFIVGGSFWVLFKWFKDYEREVIIASVVAMLFMMVAVGSNLSVYFFRMVF